MIYIAHRGLIDGPDVNLENRPQQIEQSLNQGYHCEVDVWYVNDKWFLGHDRPDYEVPYEFLEQYGYKFYWVVCKTKPVGPTFKEYEVITAKDIMLLLQMQTRYGWSDKKVVNIMSNEN